MQSLLQSLNGTAKGQAVLPLAVFTALVAFCTVKTCLTVGSFAIILYELFAGALMLLIAQLNAMWVDRVFGTLPEYLDKVKTGMFRAPQGWVLRSALLHPFLVGAWMVMLYVFVKPSFVAAGFALGSVACGISYGVFFHMVAAVPCSQFFYGLVCFSPKLLMAWHLGTVLQHIAAGIFISLVL
jgi:hypothetical protein